LLPPESWPDYFASRQNGILQLSGDWQFGELLAEAFLKGPVLVEPPLQLGVVPCVLERGGNLRIAAVGVRPVEQQN
jgi:hypothetical protein